MVDYTKGKAMQDLREPAVDAWRQLQMTLNALGLADPELEVDGDPGPKTLDAALDVVPLIVRHMLADKGR